MLTERDLILRAQQRADYVVTPVVTASSAYSAGNAVGGLITIDISAGLNGPIEQPDLSLILQSIVLIDKAAQNKAMILYLFNDIPSTPVNKTAYAPTAADMLKLIGAVSIAAADYVSVNSIGYVSGPTYRNIGMVCKPVGTSGKTALYGALATGTSGTPTFATTSDIQLRLQFSQGM